MDLTDQTSHDAPVELSDSFRTLAISHYKIGNDIRMMLRGPRAGCTELPTSENELYLSIMPDGVNATLRH